MSARSAILLLFALLALTTLAGLPGVQAADYVVVNSRDWHDLYIGTVYAGLTNQSVVAFANLGEAQLKSKLIPPDSQVTILEPSKNPVVKKYANYLSANGISKANTLSYEDYTDLQFQLLSLLEGKPNQRIDGYAVLFAGSGVEPVTIIPYLYATYSMPLFVDESSASAFFEHAQELSRRPTIIVGKMPVRIIADIKGTMRVTKEYTGEMENTTLAMVRDMARQPQDQLSASMGVISRIDRIDLQALRRGLPQFVYAGSAQDTADQISATDILVFEVISTEAADLAKSIAALTGKNLKLLVKYARGFTNIQGLSGQLLDLDTVGFPYPFAALSVVKATYYPAESTIGITLRNDGNTPALAYSTIEFGQSTYADEQVIIIPAQSTLTIPYAVDGGQPASLRVVINTLYGRIQPLAQTITGTNGEPLFVTTAAVEPAQDDSNISFLASRIDETNGVLQIDVQNNVPAPVLVSAQIISANDTIVASAPVQLRASEAGRIDIPIPYLSASDIIERPLRLVFFYGERDTRKTQAITLEVTEVIYPQGRSGSTLLFIGAGIIVLIVLIFLIRSFIKWRNTPA